VAEFIPDPIDPEQAITDTGKLAAQIYIAPAGTNPYAPKLTDEWVHIGWTEPLERP